MLGDCKWQCFDCSEVGHCPSFKQMLREFEVQPIECPAERTDPVLARNGVDVCTGIKE